MTANLLTLRMKKSQQKIGGQVLDLDIRTDWDGGGVSRDLRFIFYFVWKRLSI